MTLKSRVKKLTGDSDKEPVIVFFTTRFENEDGSADLGFIKAFICGKNITVASEPGEGEDAFRARVTAFVEGREQ